MSPRRPFGSGPDFDSGLDQAGFTLIELAISTLLLLLGLMLATQMLLESQRLLIRTAIENTQPATSLTVAMLRRDVQQAVSASEGAAGALVLSFPDRSRSRYRLAEGCLSRSEAPKDGKLGPERCLLPSVGAWSWRHETSRRLDFELILEEIDVGRGAALISDLRMRPPRAKIEIVTLSAAMRASGTRRGRW